MCLRGESLFFGDEKTMPALETFDWLIKEFAPSLDEEGRKYLAAQRDYLLKLRNEDERRRFTGEVMENVKRMKEKT